MNKNKNILIPTQVHDVHALAIEYVLRNYDINVIRWFRGDFPSKQHQSFEISDNKMDFHLHLDVGIHLSEIDLVWYRRPGRPIVKLSNEHPDYKSIEIENRLFSENHWELVNKKAIWVNNYESARKADNKLAQLIAAKNVGFTIPNTLASNNSVEIRRFLKENDKKGVIYKAFSGIHEWEEQETVFSQNVALVNFEMLPDDCMLKYSVGIFQERVSKKFEVRTLYMNGKFVSAKINLSADFAGKFDWRATPKNEFSIEPYELPHRIKEMISKFMNKLGLVTGSIDLIVTSDDDFVFLEVNESGQFIWMELCNPDISVLSQFCSFLGVQLYGTAFTIDKRHTLASSIFNSDEFERMHKQDCTLHVER